MHGPAIGSFVLSCLIASQSLAAGPQAGARFAPFGPGNGKIAVAVDPGSGTLFAGFDSGGLFRSTDGGRSWAWSGQGLGRRKIPLVAVSASGEVYAVAESSTSLEVFGSLDRGGTWTLLSVLPRPESIFLRQGKLVSGGEPGALYLALKQDLWKSEDRGRHWSRILQSKIGFGAVVAGPPGSREVYVTTFEPSTRVLGSTDGGATWKELQNGLPAGEANSLAVSPQPAGQPSKVYVGIGKNGLFESADEGTTWRQPDPSHGSLVLYDVAVDAADPATVYAAYRADRSQPFQMRISRDGGATWRSGGPLMGESPPIWGVDLFGAGGTLYAAGDIDLAASADHGGSWAYLLRGGAGPHGTSQIRQVPGDPSTLYALLGLRAFKSVDAGRTWTSFATSILQNGKAVLRDLAVDPARPATLYAAGELGVFKSVDGGWSWSPFGPEANVLALLPGGTILAGGCSMMRTPDGGAHWEEALPCKTESGGERKIEKILPDPAAPGTVYAIVAERTAERTAGQGYPRTIFRSRDDGRTWSPILAGAGVLALSPRPPAVLWAVQDVFLFVSRDGGDTFRPAGPRDLSSQGLTRRVTDLLVDDKAPETLYASTQGSGVWRSTDGGATWVQLGAEGAAHPENQADDYVFGLTAGLSRPDVLYAADGGSLARVELRP